MSDDEEGSGAGSRTRCSTAAAGYAPPSSTTGGRGSGTLDTCRSRRATDSVKPTRTQGSAAPTNPGSGCTGNGFRASGGPSLR